MRKEFIQIARDPRTLGIAILLPVVMLVLYGYGISSDIKEIQMGVVDWSRTLESRNLLRAFTQSGYFHWVYASDRYDDMERALDSRRIKVALVIPADFARQLARGRPAFVQALIDGSDPTTASVASGYLEAIVQNYSSRIMLDLVRRKGLTARPRGVPPIDARARVWYNEELKSTNFIVPGLIAVILMMTSALLTSGTIARERERGTIEQIVASPLKSRELMIGKIAAYTALAFLDVALIVLVGTLWFGAPLRGSLTLLAVCSGLFLMSALGLGLLISSAIPSQQTAMVAAIMVTMVPSILLSGFYFPIASMPSIVQAITYVVPARYFLVIVRGIFLKGIGLRDLWPQIVPLAVYGSILLTASIFAFKKRL
jgi:ABC-2 type transport system permease protein